MHGPWTKRTTRRRWMQTGSISQPSWKRVFRSLRNSMDNITVGESYFGSGIWQGVSQLDHARMTDILYHWCNRRIKSELFGSTLWDTNGIISNGAIVVVQWCLESHGGRYRATIVLVWSRCSEKSEGNYKIKVYIPLLMLFAISPLWICSYWKSPRRVWNHILKCHWTFHSQGR